MQFKNPEILYFLALLIIPILIHLFQLQRYTKISFTNVDFLKKIAIKSRKSSKLKKFIILCLRLLALTALILAFAQPYLSNSTINAKQHNFIYLDNSLSLTGKGKKGILLENAKNDLIEHIYPKATYSLLTNDDFYKNINGETLKSTIKKIKPTEKTIEIKDVLLQIKNIRDGKNTIQNNILISDFQNTNIKDLKKEKNKLIVLEHSDTNNIAIDSVFQTINTNKNIELSVIIKNYGKEQKNISLGIYNNKEMLSKQSFDIGNNQSKTVKFSLQANSTIIGKLKLNCSDSFKFDNYYNFIVDKNLKINVMCIGNSNNYLTKIYAEDEFKLSNFKLKNIEYNKIEKQQVIVLNEIEKIPTPLITSLQLFLNQGGTLIVVPNINSEITSYSTLFNKLKLGNLKQVVKDTLNITKINFEHPIFKDVFLKKVKNFQYPKINSYFKDDFITSKKILSLENNTGFVREFSASNGKVIWFNAAINKDNSNFKNTPIIVPLFYNIAQQSLQINKLYYDITKNNTIDIPAKLENNAIVSVQNQDHNIIPIQQRFNDKVRLTIPKEHLNSGIYNVTNKNKTIKQIAFNTPTTESKQNFITSNSLKEHNIPVSNSISKTLDSIENQTRVNWLWKWFLIAVIVFLLLEILILKFFKL